jgi:hypothetical protein
MFDKYNVDYHFTSGLVTFILYSQETRMVRNRVRKIEKGNFSEDSMRDAVLLVEQGMSIQKAAMEKGVKYPTLFQYVQKKAKTSDSENVRMKPHYDCR